MEKLNHSSPDLWLEQSMPGQGEPAPSPQSSPQALPTESQPGGPDAAWRVVIKIDGRGESWVGSGGDYRDHE